ncbi:hypothetical protein C8T65DRAFT_675096 [Cerioporus squamosus]|nr:hypothetical protein C8T65DRAFT_675096 [Cerioporus squamosus]
MSHDEEDIFGALYDDGDDVPEPDSAAQWGLIEACILFFEQDDDPFAPEDSISHLSDTFAQRQRKSQLYVSTFVARVLSRQQHTHLFLVVVSGASARIVRADREAFFATHPFPYKTSPTQSFLREFFRRFTGMGRAERGIDTTATLLRSKLGSSGRRITFMHAMANQELYGAADYARTCFKESLDLEWPWYSVTIEGLEFLIAKPWVYSDKLSRASRGYVGVCYSQGLQCGNFAWLKDTWRRVLDDEYEQEGAVLSDLNRLDVQGVPTLVCHEDVADHRLNLKQTLGRLCRKQVQHPRSRVERVHYRVVTAEVGVPIAAFDNGKQLATIFRDYLIAHREAYAKAGILHRDVSEGNLLMVPYDSPDDDGIGYEGLIIDWEYSERISRRSAPGFVYKPTRRGTWDFLSVNAVNHPDVPVSPADDFESFFHVFVSLGLTYLPHNCTNPAQFDEEYFPTRTDDTGVVASPLKERCVKQGRLIVNLQDEVRLRFGTRTLKKRPRTPIQEVFLEHPINRIMKAWLPLIKTRYDEANKVDSLQQQDVPHRVVLRPEKENIPGPGSASAFESSDAYRVRKPPLSSLELNVEVPFLDDLRDYEDDDAEASELALHDAMIKALSDALVRESWPALDKTPDQVKRQADSQDGVEVEERVEDDPLGNNDEQRCSPSSSPERPSKRRRMY